MSVQGMTCASCAARVEKKLNTIDGVVATVNFATEAAIVTAPADVAVQQLIDAVEQAGYRAEILDRGAGGAPADGPQEPAGRGGDADMVAYLRRRLIVALVLFVPLTDLSVLLSLFPWSRFPGWQWVLIAVAAPVVVWSAWPFHAAALRNARHGSVSMDTLVSLGITAACGWSVYAMFALDHGQGGLSFSYLLLHASGGGIYLEVAASVTTFLLAGRLYEAKARRDAGDAMRELAAAGAQGCVRAGARRHRASRPGHRPARGAAVRGAPGGAHSRRRGGGIRPVRGGPEHDDRGISPGRRHRGRHGGRGHGGGGRRLVVRAEKVGRDTQLAHLVALVEQAQSQKAAIQRLADRICGIFVPAVLVASGLTLAGWLLAGSPAERAFSAALAVLIIACPCALGLATPAALMVACGRGAQLGIFITRYQALESSRAVDTVVLDKTGTVTTGVMAVTGVLTADGQSRETLLRQAGAVEQASEHPVAAAISAAAQAELGSLPQAEGFLAMPGLGARGSVDDHDVIIGRADLFAQLGMAVPEDLAGQCRQQEQAGCTVVLAGWDGQVRGGFTVADTVKPSAAAAVAELRRLGLRTVLLTGDSQATAEAVAAQAGTDEVIAGALPDHKVAVIRDLQARGRRVAMVGDGVNDGPALAAADLGMALGSGTDVAISAADLIVLRDDLGAVPDAIGLARGTLAVIRGNLAWAFGYNLAAIPLAAAGFLNPLIAGAAMALSSAFVVANSVRLRNFGAPATKRPDWSRPHRARGPNAGATEPSGPADDSRKTGSQEQAV